MFNGLRRIFNRNTNVQVEPQDTELTFTYESEKGGRKFCFISDVPIEEETLLAAIDIIYDRAVKGKTEQGIAKEVAEKCFSEWDTGMIDINSNNKGKKWRIIISPNPFAF